MEEQKKKKTIKKQQIQGYQIETGQISDDTWKKECRTKKVDRTKSGSK